MPTTIGDALGVDYRGGEAHISPFVRTNHSFDALSVSFQMPEPITRLDAPNITHMLNKQSQGTGKNIDIWA